MFQTLDTKLDTRFKTADISLYNHLGYTKDECHKFTVPVGCRADTPVSLHESYWVSWAWLNTLGTSVERGHGPLPAQKKLCIVVLCWKNMSTIKLHQWLPGSLQDMLPITVLGQWTPLCRPPCGVDASDSKCSISTTRIPMVSLQSRERVKNMAILRAIAVL